MAPQRDMKEQHRVWRRKIRNICCHPVRNQMECRRCEWKFFSSGRVDYFCFVQPPDDDPDEKKKRIGGAGAEKRIHFCGKDGTQPLDGTSQLILI